MKKLLLIILFVPSVVFALPPNCKVLKDSTDGAKKGFLWKQSLDYPGAVVLFPKEYNFKEVTIVSKKGVKLDTLKYYYPYSEDGSDRPVWRCNKKAASFPRDSFVRGLKGKVCWRLRNPKERID